MQFVGWMRHECDAWADVIEARSEWMAWIAVCAIYSDLPEIERIVLPSGLHPEGLPNAEENG